jgi:hypothetical protein
MQHHFIHVSGLIAQADLPRWARQGLTSGLLRWAEPQDALKSLSSEEAPAELWWLYSPPWSALGRVQALAGQSEHSAAPWATVHRQLLRARQTVATPVRLLSALHAPPVSLVEEALQPFTGMESLPSGSIEELLSTLEAELIQPGAPHDDMGALLAQLHAWAAPEVWDVLEALEAADWDSSRTPLMREDVSPPEPGAVAHLARLLAAGERAPVVEMAVREAEASLRAAHEQAAVAAESAALALAAAKAEAEAARAEHQAAQEATQGQLKEAQEEGELLLLQLHQVQEELEQLFLQAKDKDAAHQKAQTDAEAAAKAAAEQSAKALAAAQAEAKAALDKSQADAKAALDKATTAHQQEAAKLKEDAAAKAAEHDQARKAQADTQATLDKARAEHQAALEKAQADAKAQLEKSQADAKAGFETARAEHKAAADKAQADMQAALQKAKAEHQAALDHTQGQLKEAQEEGELLLLQLHQVQEELEQIFLQGKDKEAAHAREMVQQQEESRARLADALRNMESLASRRDDLARENAELLALRERMSTELARHHETVVNLSVQLSALSNEKAVLVANVAHLAGEREDLAQRIESLSSSIADVTGERDRLVAQRGELLEQLDSHVVNRDLMATELAKLAEAKAALGRQVESLIQEAADLAAERDSLIAKESEAIIRLEAALSEKSGLEGQLSNAVHQSAVLESDRASLTAERDALREEHAQMLANRDLMAAELARLTEARSELGRRLDELARENAGLLLAQEELQANVQKSHDETQSLLVQLQHTQNELGAVFQRSLDTEEAHARSVAEAEDRWTEEKARWEREREHLTAQGDALREEHAQMLANRDLMAAELARLTEARSELGRRLDQLAWENASFKSTREAMTSELKEEKAKAEVLLQQLRQTQDELGRVFQQSLDRETQAAKAAEEAEQKISRIWEQQQQLLRDLSLGRGQSEVAKTSTTTSAAKAMTPTGAQTPQSLPVEQLEQGHDVVVVAAERSGPDPWVDWRVRDSQAPGGWLTLRTAVRSGTPAVGLPQRIDDHGESGSADARRPPGSELLVPGLLAQRDPAQLALFRSISAHDWSSLQAVLARLKQALNSGEVIGKVSAVEGFDVTPWRSLVSRLTDACNALPAVFRFNAVRLRSAQADPHYEHIWLDFEGAAFGPTRLPGLNLRIASVKSGGSTSLKLPQIEIPLTPAGTPPFPGWVQVRSDGYGPRLELRADLVRSAFDLRIWSQLPREAQSLLLSLIAALPIALNSMRLSSKALSRPWLDWIQLVEGMMNAMRVALRDAAASAAAPAAQVTASTRQESSSVSAVQDSSPVASQLLQAPALNPDLASIKAKPSRAKTATKAVKHDPAVQPSGKAAAAESTTAPTRAVKPSAAGAESAASAPVKAAVTVTKKAVAPTKLSLGGKTASKAKPPAGARR